jgi:hypothetical protein
MAADVNKEIELEIAYVLFIDIVGYSKLVTSEQRRLLQLLNRTAELKPRNDSRWVFCQTLLNRGDTRDLCCFPIRKNGALRPLPHFPAGTAPAVTR